MAKDHHDVPQQSSNIDALMRLETMGLNVDTKLTDDNQIQETIDKITNALTNQRDIATTKTRLLRYYQQEEQSTAEFATKLRESSLMT